MARRPSATHRLGAEALGRLVLLVGQRKRRGAARRGENAHVSRRPARRLGGLRRLAVALLRLLVLLVLLLVLLVLLLRRRLLVLLVLLLVLLLLLLLVVLLLLLLLLRLGLAGGNGANGAVGAVGDGSAVERLRNAPGRHSAASGGAGPPAGGTSQDAATGCSTTC